MHSLPAYFGKSLFESRLGKARVDVVYSSTMREELCRVGTAGVLADSVWPGV